jgi:outer membrane protein assembly factor BamD
MNFSSFATLRGLVLPFAAASLFLVASPVAHAQVPTAQTGGSGQNDADQPAPAADQPADKPADKPADATAPATNGDKPAADAPAADAPDTPAAPPPGTVAPTTGSSTTTTTTKNADGSTSVSTSKTIKLPFHKKAANTNTTTASNKDSKKPKTASEEKDTSGGAEPDKVLYDRAQDDLKHGRYTEGRLALQTLVNTYPDSEYLAKAKLMVADSYYKEGGTNNLTQAVQEYKDFQTFFPFLENEASYAQMQVGLAHYHMMEKADRDTTQAQQAEDEFQLFMTKYPQSPLIPKAEQYLRDVQEVLADGEFKIANYYYQTKQDYRASAARLVELTDRYPLYSNNDQALSMLGDIYDRARQLSKGEDDKNHWADLAAKCYSRILTQYPLSHSAPEAESRLKAMNRPIPQADPEALAREQQQIAFEKTHHENTAMRNAMSMVKSNPDTTYASRYGTPQLNPPDDAVSATDVLKSNAQGPQFTVDGGSRKAATTTDDSSGGGDKVEEVTGTGHAEDPNAATTGVGVEIITPVDDRAQPTSDRSQPNRAPATTAPPQAQTSTMDNNAAAAGAGSASSTTGAVGDAPPPATVGTTPATPSSDSSSGAATSNSAIDGSSTTAPAAGAAATGATPAKPASSDDAQGESTSKKKKGVKKIMPWSKGN